MVFVKVRETYDLKTVQNKMTVIGIHTPNPSIIKKNFPGLLMQCRSYRPVSADVNIACASVLPLDPLGVGTEAGDVAPEDIFNPILYKAMSNKGMSQLEARITQMSFNTGVDVEGNSAIIDADSVTNISNEFNVYYGLLSQTNVWKHANPQQGLSMSSLRPLVYELVYNVGDCNTGAPIGSLQLNAPDANGNSAAMSLRSIVGDAKPFPWIPCTTFSYYQDSGGNHGESPAGFGTDGLYSAETNVPWMKVFCGCIIVPPSRLHSLYYRMVVEWTIEFSSIRPVGEITNMLGLSSLGGSTHYTNFSYSKVKEALTGDEESLLDSDSCMVAANVDIDKVM